MAAMTTIEGRVLDPSRAPVPGVRLRLERVLRSPSSDELVLGSLEVKSDDEGNLRAQVMPGRYHLRLSIVGKVLYDSTTTLAAGTYSLSALLEDEEVSAPNAPSGLAVTEAEDGMTVELTGAPDGAETVEV